MFVSNVCFKSDQTHFKVSKDVSVGQELQALFKQYESFPELKEYPIETAISELQRAGEALDHFKASINGWKAPLEFGTHRDKLFALVESHEECLSTCSSYKECVLKVSNKNKGDKQAKALNWKRRREKFSDIFRYKHSPVPPVIAHICGSHLMDRIDDADASGVVLKHVGGPRFVIQTTTYEELRQPLLLLPSEHAGAETTHWHRQCDKLFHDMAAKFNQKITDMKQALFAADPVPAATFGSVDCVPPFEWNPGDSKVFTAAEQVRTLIQTVVVGKCDISLNKLPVRSHAGFFHVIEGSFVVTVCGPDITIDHWSDLESWLTRLDTKTLPSCHSYLLTQGCSLWIPLVHMFVPVAVPPHGMPPIDCEKKEFKYI